MAAANWRTLKKLDAHIHILPDAVHTANPDADDVWVYADLRQYVQIMRENHIERAVIMPFNDPFLMSMEFTAGAVHRNLAEMKRRYPGRFYAFADIDVRNSQTETVDALCRAIDDHALDGIKLHPNNSGLALDSDYNCAIFAFAQERRIPVAVHSYPNAEDDLSAAKRIVKTAERYPDLKLIVSHMGAFRGNACFRLPVMWICPRSCPIMPADMALKGRTRFCGNSARGGSSLQPIFPPVAVCGPKRSTPFIAGFLTKWISRGGSGRDRV